MNDLYFVCYMIVCDILSRRIKYVVNAIGKELYHLFSCASIVAL